MKDTILDIPQKPFIGEPGTSLPDCPKEFEDTWKLGDQVMRYVYQEGSFPHIFHDPVSSHTQRSVWTVDVIDLDSSLDADKIRRILWIHDLPEILCSIEVGHDMTTIDKNKDSKTITHVTNQEMQAAMDLFDVSDYELYEDFETACDGFRNYDIGLIQKASPEAIVARLIDCCLEGVGSFHFFLHQWFTSPGYKQDKPIPRTQAFEYAFSKGLSWYELFEKMSDTFCSHFVTSLIREHHFRYIQDLWGRDMILPSSEIQALYDHFWNQMEVLEIASL